MACLDTTFLIDLLRGKEEIADLKDSLEKIEVRLTVASPSVMELWAGACAVASEKEKNNINEMIKSLDVLELNEVSAKQSGLIEADLLKRGVIIETEDIMIAGIAISNGEKVVTRDQHYARISGLKVLKY